MSLLARKLGRDARAQRAQFAAVALTLALGVAVFGAAYDSYDNLRASYVHVYDRLAFADFTVTGGDSAAIAAGAGRLPGPPVVETRLQADLPFRIRTDDGTRTLVGRLVGQPPAGEPEVNALSIQEGQGLGAGAGDGGGVVVERHMADHFHLDVGDRFEVFAGSWRPLRIAGIAVSPEYLWPARSRQDLLSSPDDFGVAFVPDGLVTELAGASAVPQVLVRVAEPGDRPGVERELRRLAAAHGAGDVLVRPDQPSNAALQQDVAAFRELAVFLPVLFLLAATLAAYVLLGRLVRTQRAQIGTLLANGYPRRRLQRHYLAYGALVGGAGSIVGAAAGIGLARWLTSAYTGSLDIPLAIARFHPATPLLGIAAGTVAGALAAWRPAGAAGRVAPAEAMRGIVPAVAARRSGLERLPLVGRLPVRARLALRNLGRNRRRTASTGIGVAVAGVLVLSSLGMLDTVALVFDEQYHDIQRQDAQLYVAPGSGPQVEASVADRADVVAVEPAIEAPVVLSHGSHRYQTALTGFRPGTTMHRFDSALPDDGLLLGDGMRSILDVAVGDQVEVAVAGGSPVPATVRGFVHEPLGSLAYTTIAAAGRLAGRSGIPSLLVRYAPGTERADARAELGALPGVVALRDVRAEEESVRQLLGLFYAIVGVMLLFGSVLTLVVLFNTLSVNLAERTVELATLRAAGGRVAALARMVTAENLLLVAAAIPAALLAGWLAGGWLISSFNTDLYHFRLRLRPLTPVVVVAALLAATAVLHLPARRHVRRLDVARVVRERAL